MAESHSISFGIALPQVFYPGSVDMALVGSFVTRAEALGFESLWVQERIIGGVDSLEPVNLLSYVAALTQTAKLGTSVLIPSTRNPVMLAKEITTLDHLSNGRLIVGVGLGGRVEQYHLFGAPSERRVGYFLESIEVMKALWQEPVASFEGRYWTLRGETMNPKPVQKPHPPIWIGGTHPNALRRSVRLGDGWMGNGNSSTEQFKAQREVLVRALNEAGRDPETFPISKRVYIAVDNDEARAERRIAEYFGHHYGVAPDRAVQVSITGRPAKCVEGLMQVIKAGAGMLMLNAAFDYQEQMEILAREVVPHLRS